MRIKITNYYTMARP